MADQADNLPDEVWKAIPGWEDRYEVSNLGRVKSKAHVQHFLSKRGNPVTRKVGERLMRATTGPYGYLRVSLQRDTKIRPALVHRLVCEAFHGPCPPDKEHCAHWDGNTGNNRAENLRWVTARENGSDRIRLGAAPRGERVHNSKLDAASVRQMRLRYRRGEGTNALAREYGVSPATACNAIKRKTWKHI